jgi:predicted nucleic acid-binding Zn ribbon protein
VTRKPARTLGSSGLKPVGDLLPHALARLGLLGAWERWRVVEEWPSIAGEALGRHAQAVRVDGDTLVVEARHPAVMFELSHRKSELLARIHARPFGGAIKDVRLVLGRSQ